MMNNQTQESFCLLIERITNKNRNNIQQSDLTQVRNLVQSYCNGPFIGFEVVMERLKSNHSQSRLLAAEVLDYIFMRCKAVRKYASDNIKQILQLTIGYNSAYKLPQPPQAAWKLRNNAISMVKRWRKAFGNNYPQISIAVSFLEKNLQMQFPAIAGAEELEQQQRQQQRRIAVSTREYYKICRVYEGFIQQLSDFQKQFNEQIEMLQQKESTRENSPNDLKGEDEDEVLWEDVSIAKEQASANFGISSYAAIPSTHRFYEEKQEELEARKTLLQNLKDFLQSARKQHIPKIQKWLRIMSTAEVGRHAQDADNLQLQSRMRELVELKTRIVALCNTTKDFQEDWDNQILPDSEYKEPNIDSSSGHRQTDKLFNSICDAIGY
eukprot:TRINITY_DN35443_c0_g1_i1.p1 TRINITY_DN35443_c0_g1~~TRINITY_DN35443_c0_g1_i1.p1  ORF type:complete len:381 (+),score=25.62 TRINITY_DN35443_c0_g1_i1:94-1236(+)